MNKVGIRAIKANGMIMRKRRMSVIGAKIGNRTSFWAVCFARLSLNSRSFIFNIINIVLKYRYKI